MLRGEPPETTLCITHWYRERVNAEVNLKLRVAHPEAVFVDMPKDFPAGTANKPQDMYLWPGIILMAKVPSEDKKLKNGFRYMVLSFEGGTVELVKLDKDDAGSGDGFELSVRDVANKLRLTHAITYFSSQARTITGSLRLMETNSKHFNIRCLIVGLGRAPNGWDAVSYTHLTLPTIYSV